jgi:hypothetical protein
MRVESGFNRLDQDLRHLRTEMNVRFDGLQRMMIQIAGGTIVAVLGTLASVIATRA